MKFNTLKFEALELKFEPWDWNFNPEIEIWTMKLKFDTPRSFQEIWSLKLIFDTPGPGWGLGAQGHFRKFESWNWNLNPEIEIWTLKLKFEHWNWPRGHFRKLTPGNWNLTPWNLKPEFEIYTLKLKLALKEVISVIAIVRWLRHVSSRLTVWLGIDLFIPFYLLEELNFYIELIQDQLQLLGRRKTFTFLFLLDL